MGRLRDKRDAKRDASKEQRELAEQGLQGNVDMFQEQYDRDFGTSALDNLAADPMLVAAQQRVLDRYGDLSDDGWTDLDRQALEQQQMQSRREEQSQREGVMLDAARRGDTSGGNTLLASLMAQQGSANRDAERGTSLALEGRSRALDALANQGTLAGQMRDQRFGEQATVGSAMDAFRQWGAGHQLSAAQGLAGARGDQAQYQLQRAEQLKPKSVGEIMGTIMDWTQAGLELGSGIKGLTGGGDGGGAAKSLGGGAPAGGSGLPSVPAERPGAPATGRAMAGAQPTNPWARGAIRRA